MTTDAKIHRSLFDGNETNVVLYGAKGSLEACIVRNGTPLPGGRHFAYGLDVEDAHQVPGQPRSEATVQSSIIESNVGAGLIVFSSDVYLRDSIVRNNRVDLENEFGDGVIVIEDPQRAELDMLRTRVEGNARAGVALFSAQGRMRNSSFQCNPIDINGEMIPTRSAFSFDGSGDLLCGCPYTAERCIPVSSGLAAPDLRL